MNSYFKHYSRIKSLLNAIFKQINIRNSLLFLIFLCPNLTSFKLSEFNISRRTEVNILMALCFLLTDVGNILFFYDKLAVTSKNQYQHKIFIDNEVRNNQRRKSTC